MGSPEERAEKMKEQRMNERVQNAHIVPAPSVLMSVSQKVSLVWVKRRRYVDPGVRPWSW